MNARKASSRPLGHMLRWLLILVSGYTIVTSGAGCSAGSKGTPTPRDMASIEGGSPPSRNSDTKNVQSAWPADSAAAWDQLEYNAALPYFIIARRDDQNRNYISAIANYQRGIAVFSAAVDERGNLGIDLLKVDKKNDAVKYWRSAVDLAENRSRSWSYFHFLDKGDALFQRQQFAEAFAVYDNTITAQIKARQVNPSFLDSGAVDRLTKGLALARTGRYTQASKKFQDVLRLSPYYEDAYYFLGQSLAASGRKADAIAEWEGVLTHGFRNQTNHGPDAYQLSALRMLIQTVD